MMKRDTYAVFERMIVDLYEQDALTLHLLDSIARKYRFARIDSADSQCLQTRDGKDLHQICIGLIYPTFPLAVRGSSADHEEYWEQELKKWEEIVRRRWNWHDYCNPFPTQALQDEAA